MLAYDAMESHPLVDAFLADQLGKEDPLERSIDSRDYMFRSALEQRAGQRDLALIDYFQGGLSVARLVRRALLWRFDPGFRPRLLDFAAGFGRGTRFLIADHDPRRIWASDILPPAVCFLGQTLGVHAFPSAARPEALACPDRFDVIVTASFFSHLPRTTFVPWLQRLYQLLEPGGLLILSVHGQNAWQGSLDSAGHSFLRVSEIGELPIEDYGISQVSEAFMARGIAEATAGEADYRRLPRGLWSYQDVYLVTPGAATAAPFPAGEPLGHLYGAEHPEGDTRYLRLHGWATAAPGSRVERVEVAINGEPAGATEPVDTLPDVAAKLRQPERPVVGWQIVVEGPRRHFDPRDIAMVKVVATGGESFVVRLDTLRGLLASEALAELRQQKDRVAKLERQLEQMRQSRFWKLRDAWWQLRRRLGRGAEADAR